MRKAIIQTPYGHLRLKALTPQDMLSIFQRHAKLFDEVVAEHVGGKLAEPAGEVELAVKMWKFVGAVVTAV